MYIKEKETILLTEKNAQHESCELSFIWGQNEDCSLGNSISALRNCCRGNREGERNMILVKRGYLQSDIHFGRGLLLVMKNRCPC